MVNKFWFRLFMKKGTPVKIFLRNKNYVVNGQVRQRPEYIYGYIEGFKGNGMVLVKVVKVGGFNITHHIRTYPIRDVLEWKPRKDYR